MSSHLIQFACFCEVEAIGQMAHFCHLCYEAKEMNKTQILLDKIFTLSWIKTSWNFNMPQRSFMKYCWNFYFVHQSLDEEN
jgi:hypothetical protein